mmetsp:Transcript_9227/g.31772  ORF Transcript_9227/g.31772 Transcript_9227/m.31772 type:complete len:245 (+) Transcript_9227:1695-2429(+)
MRRSARFGTGRFAAGHASTRRLSRARATLPRFSAKAARLSAHSTPAHQSPGKPAGGRAPAPLPPAPQHDSNSSARRANGSRSTTIAPLPSSGVRGGAPRGGDALENSGTTGDDGGRRFEDTRNTSETMRASGLGSATPRTSGRCEPSPQPPASPPRQRAQRATSLRICRPARLRRARGRWRRASGGRRTSRRRGAWLQPSALRGAICASLPASLPASRRGPPRMPWRARAAAAGRRSRGSRARA